MKGVVLVILDGYGIGPSGEGNAISLANPSNINSFLDHYPNCLLEASGEAVGLPSGEVGNTEVGHINIGAGRKILQSLSIIDAAIADGSFFTNSEILAAMKNCKSLSSTFHLVGLLGQGNVHASFTHLVALLTMAKKEGLTKVAIHAIVDGRDSPPASAESILEKLETKIIEIGVGKIVSIMGRYFAMDRDKRWERIEKAYRCLTVGSGKTIGSWKEAIAASYKRGIYDEFIEPINIVDMGRPTTIQSGDSVFFFNYRVDRLEELTKAFVLDDFERDADLTFYDPVSLPNAPFKRGPKIENLYFITLTEYAAGLSTRAAFSQEIVVDTLSEVLSDCGVKQLKLTESEKARFVTYHFNGRRETEFDGEERIIVPSPKVDTYDKKPEMGSRAITEILLDSIDKAKYQFILVNFANCDMVAHTGNIQASIKAVNIIDENLGKIAQKCLSMGLTLLITADHGNIEELLDVVTGEKSTEHDKNPVPFIAIAENLREKHLTTRVGTLSDVAPTVLALMGIAKPTTMTGRDLLSSYAT